MSILSLFCGHNYKLHAKKKYEWKETQVIHETRFDYKPTFETHVVSTTYEVLICKKCGKIKKIKY